MGDLPSTWKLMPLSDCMAAIIDYRGKTPRKTSAGIPLITAKIVKNGRIETPEEFIDPAEYEEWMRRGLPERGDVLITTEAPLGEVAQLRDARVALAQRLITLRGKPGLLDSTFLKFLMQSTFVQEQLKARSSGTTVLGIKQSELRQVSLIVPELIEQQAIACILGTLDDKIELNRRVNETLEATARAIFKSWFVDFDPVREKMERKDAKTQGRKEGNQDDSFAALRPGALALNPAIADLFPGEFEESKLGKIPRGWRVGTFGEVARNPRRGVPPSELDPGTPYIALEHMPRRRIALGQWGIADDVASNKFRFRRGEILFGKLRPYFHKIGIAPTDGVCSTDILVVAPSSQGWFGFVMGHISSVEFVNHTDATSMGTKMPRTNWSDMSRYEIVIPGEAVAGTFSRLVHPVVERIIANIQETHSLTALRDTLLPKLISGELRVQDAERFIGRVHA